MASVGQQAYDDARSVKMIKKIGEGAGGKVYLAVHSQSRCQLAVKVVPGPKSAERSPKLVKRLKAESKTMLQLDHKYLLKSYGVVETPEYAFLLTQYLPGGDLLEFINRRGIVAETDARFIFKRLVKAVQYMHSKGWVHRDIKPENVFLTENQLPILGDFGFASRYQEHELLTDCVGTFPYTAPEILRRSPYRGPGVDVWSLGSVLLAMLSARLPFQASSPDRALELVMTGDFEVPNRTSEQAVDLLICMLDPNPATRITLEEVLAHPWMTEAIITSSSGGGKKQRFLNFLRREKDQKKTYGSGEISTRTKKARGQPTEDKKDPLREFPRRPRC